MTDFVVTLRCPDQPGIVRGLADGILTCGGNILESSQYSDPRTGQFFMRTSFETPSSDVEDVKASLMGGVTRFGPVVRLRPLAQSQRAMIMVSRYDHCLMDLLYRRRTGELPVELPLVVSNHEDCRAVVERDGLEFVHLPVTQESQRAAESRVLELVEEHQIDFVILARYMRILSDDLCARLPARIINIHHSFLPGFKGARPYAQAFTRGVKLIGATAHYVTADLDEGPIIEQDVVRVDHTATPKMLTAIGRDVERVVLARAVTLHAQDRVLLNGDRTVVFG